MRARIRKDAAPAAAPAPAQDVSRLHDMLVEEVSLVDRAANKRTFLVVKRDTGEIGAVGVELASDGKGGFVPLAKEAAPAEKEAKKPATAAKPAFPGAAPPFEKKEAAAEKTEKDGVTGGADMGDAHPAVTPPSGAPAAPPKPAGGPATGALTLSPDAKVALGQGIQTTIQQLTDYLGQVQSATEDPSVQGTPPEIHDTLQGVATNLMTLAGQTAPAPGGAAQDQMNPNAPPSTQGAAAAAADAARQSAKRANAPADVQKSLDVLAAELVSIEKIGAKMAKERLARFKEAIDKLHLVLKELEGAALEEEKPAPAAPPPKLPAKKPAAAAAPPPAAPAPAAQHVPSFVMRDPAAKAALTPEAQAVVDALQKQVAELTAVTKRQGSALEQVAQLRKQVGVSNAIPVERDGNGTQSGQDDVRWPRDMNVQPANKRGGKQETFFDR